MNLDHDFVQESKLSEDQKIKRLSPKMEHFFPQIQVDTYAQMHTRAKLLWGIYPPIFPRFGTPAQKIRYRLFLYICFN